MSAITPLPPAPPAPPVPVPAPPRSPFLYLVTDPWIAISWLFLIGPGALSVLMLLQESHTQSMSRSDATPAKAIFLFLFTGYCFWSSYFGLAACWRLAASRLSGLVSFSRIASMWFAVGCFSMITFGWMLFLFALVLGLLYSFFGGGIYQFARRWWLLAHGQQPPFLTASRRVQSY